MAQVMAHVGKVVAAGVAKYVRVDTREAGALGGEAYEVTDGLPCERLAALGQEQPGQAALPYGEVAPYRPQFVAGDGLLHGQPALEPLHPQRSDRGPIRPAAR